ncbi:uncharacterized protein LOC125492356 isoform X2 [Beta vulgaris subsp. vulgaris]|uniref:uncharacterized protein LOC125492356 isoform X2 n=1 Tax=Beta vulgaris subsp. vulgaris TaxID=3555 RepID=UPI0020366CC3|nr:uncharacterized protein LOC125492356 isoform X2 [Beta vulgaris subsp. vulgaris]
MLDVLVWVLLFIANFKTHSVMYDDPMQMEDYTADSLLSSSMRDDESGSEDQSPPPRPRRTIIKPAIFRSPYLVKYSHLIEQKRGTRQIDNTYLADFAFEAGDKEDLLYDDGNTFLNRSHFLSLGDDVEIWNGFLDAWARILNHRNSERMAGSTKRLFFSTIAHHLLFPNASNPPPSTPEQAEEDRKTARLTENTRMEQFVERLTYECREQGITHVDQFELVFFPVCASDHFYVFCLNFNKMTLDILDNRILPENVSIHDKYKDYPAKIAIAYGRFLVSLGFNMISTPLKPRIVEMPWRTNSNTYDCGIFAMRHMEKYTGEWENNFETGLIADNFDKIKKLRIQYCIDILVSNVNTRAAWVADSAKAQAKGKSQHK